MRLTSSVFQNAEKIPDLYTCRGEGFNPPLMIENVPVEAVSLAIIVDDPDAPNKVFTHWLLWNINPDQILISENSIPAGSIQGTNSGGHNSYYPPCPPFATHHYYFRLFALNISLALEKNTSREKLLEAMQMHILDKAQLMGTSTG